MPSRIKLTSREIQTLLEASPPEFPKYATQIINLANQNAQGTRPRVVGQQTELIRQFPGHTLAEWETWYVAQYPDAIEEATRRIYAMIEQLRASIQHIDEAMVERWVRDLVLVKTFIGLRFQEAVLKRVAQELSLPYRLSSTSEEARGIDGFIGELPVSIKPDTYKAMAPLPESIEAGIIYYTKVKGGLVLEYALGESAREKA